MFKLVVLFAVIAVAVARPGYLHQELVAAPIVPLATSYSSRVDVHHEPIVKVHQVAVAPVVAAVHAAPVVAAVHAAPVYSSAVSYQSRTDIHHEPIVAHVATHAHLAPVVATHAHVAPYVAAHSVHGW